MASFPAFSIPAYPGTRSPASSTNSVPASLPGRKASASASAGMPDTISPALPAAKEKSCPDRKSTRLNSSHVEISYAVFCLKKKIGADPDVLGVQVVHDLAGRAGSHDGVHAL